MSSERNVVVEIALAARASGRRLAPRRRAGRAEIRATVRAEFLAATAASAPIEHREHRIEALQHDLGRVFLDTILVSVFAGLELALEINLRALLQVLLDDLAQPLVEDHHPVPLGLFPALAGILVAPVLRCRDRQIGDRTAVLRAPDLRIAAQIADQNHLVY